MKNITPHLWFDNQAKEAADFYTALFPESSVTNITTLHNTPSGDTDIVSFTLSGNTFMAMSAGPEFKLNPSISFFLNFDPSRDSNARQELDRLWKGLSDGGTELMSLGEYPFSKHYGWIQDKYGVSWQLILSSPDGDERPFIVPSLLFANNVSGKAEEAINFYVSVFSKASDRTSKNGSTSRYPDKKEMLMYADFILLDQWFVAMDSDIEHTFSFNEATSFIVHCDTQQEIDYLWKKLSAVPESEQCGWLKDKYGVSWQIVPAALDEMMSHGTPAQIDRLTQALLPMKKLTITSLQQAYEEKH